MRSHSFFDTPQTPTKHLSTESQQTLLKQSKQHDSKRREKQQFSLQHHSPTHVHESKQHMHSRHMSCFFVWFVLFHIKKVFSSLHKIKDKPLFLIFINFMCLNVTLPSMECQKALRPHENVRFEAKWRSHGCKTIRGWVIHDRIFIGKSELSFKQAD